MIELILAKLAQRTTQYIAAGLAVVLILLATYLQGRSDGKAVMQAQMFEESIRWQAEVAQAQAYYGEKANDLYNLYEEEVGKLANQIINTPIYVPIYIPASVDTYVPQGFINLHNDAAAGKQLSSAQSNAGQMSKKKLSDVGTVVATNYYECNSIRLQLITLQGIINEYQKIQAGLK